MGRIPEKNSWRNSEGIPAEIIRRVWERFTERISGRIPVEIDKRNTERINAIVENIVEAIPKNNPE